MEKLTDMQEIWNYLELMCRPPRSFSRKIDYSELETSTVNLISLRQWGNEQTDRHTRNLKLFGTSVQTSQECLQKIWEILAHQELEISTVNIISLRKWGNEKTDRHPRNLKLFWTSAETSQECLLKFEKDSSSRTTDIQR